MAEATCRMRCNQCPHPGIGFNYSKPAKDAIIVARFLNDHLCTTIKDGPNGRFIGLGTVPLQDPELAIEELRRCVLELGFAGVQIGSHVNSWNLDAPQLEQFWSQVEQLDCAVFVHPWDMCLEERRQEYWFPWLLGMPHETSLAMSSMILGGIFERHPLLRVCFAHGGGCFPSLIGRIVHGFQSRPDLCQRRCKTDPRQFLERIYVDSLVHDKEVLKLILSKFGPDRIMLGSDYPFPLGESDHPGRLVEECHLHEDDKIDAEMREKILWRNAAQFLKLSHQ